MVKQAILTQNGLEKVKSELEDLKNYRRPQIIERLKSARALGDLSENSEYDDARNEQSFIEGRIEELDGIIRHAKIISKNSSNGQINLGSKVKCKVDGDIETYELVGSVEADPFHGKISIDSPLGKELVGKKTGDKANVKAPGGNIEYAVLAIE